MPVRLLQRQFSFFVDSNILHFENQSRPSSGISLPYWYKVKEFPESYRSSYLKDFKKIITDYSDWKLMPIFSTNKIRLQIANEEIKFEDEDHACKPPIHRPLA